MQLQQEGFAEVISNGCALHFVVMKKQRLVHTDQAVARTGNLDEPALEVMTTVFYFAVPRE